MQLDIRRLGATFGEAARGRLERRLEFALGRVSHRLGRVWVHLSEPREGLKRIRVLARVRRVGDVLVEDQDGDLGVLIDRMARRAGQAVLRALTRRAEGRKGE
jgi:hypothetical protein